VTSLRRAPRPVARPRLRSGFSFCIPLIHATFRTLHQVSSDLNRPPAVHPPLPELIAQPEPTNEHFYLHAHQFVCCSGFPMFILFGIIWSIGNIYRGRKKICAKFGNIDDFAVKICDFDANLGALSAIMLRLCRHYVIEIIGYQRKPDSLKYNNVGGEDNENTQTCLQVCIISRH
jgi:hypothetical protein